MTLHSSSVSRRAIRLSAVAFVLLAAVSSLAGYAPAAVKPVPPAPQFSASIEQSATAVPAGGTIGLSAVIRLPQPASYLQARMQIKRNGGRVVFQRTKTLPNAGAGTIAFAFSRPLEGLGLDPGAYPVSLQVVATIHGSTLTTDVATELRVYDPSKPRVPVAIVARVETRPLTDPAGRFAIDPAIATKSRDDVDRIVAVVMSDPGAHVTLALSPLAVQEWQAVSRGYTLADGANVAAGTPVPLSYAATLQGLKAAILTNRLELTALGYSDPNLLDLAANKLTDDVEPQYASGLSAYFASLETTPSAGTVPAGGGVPKAIAESLHGQGVRYIVVEGSSARIGKKAAAAGAYPVAGTKLNALVIDGGASKALSAGETSAALAGSFARAQSSTVRQPYIVRVDLGDGRATATSTLVPAIQALESAPWTQLALCRECSPPTGSKPVSLPSTPGASSHKEFWAAVRSGRTNAEALLAALGAANGTARTAQSQSLVSESHSWSGPGGTYRLAPEGLSFAQTASGAGKAIFGKVHVSTQPVTLAGATGQVPVNIQNGSQETLDVFVVAKSGSGIEVLGSNRIPTRLPPRETFVQIPVDMHSVLNGKLTVEVVSGSLVISRQTVTIRRSYLDRIALVIGIVIVLGGLLAFIVRRVATSPEIESDEPDDDDADYTE